MVTSVSTEQFLVFVPSDPIVAAPGGEAILPCSLSPAMSVEKMELRWFRSRFSEAVFVYRDQQEQKQEQMFHHGKAAVCMGNVQESDRGIYVCFFRQGLFYEEAILELKVAGWYPKPQVQWRDSRGEKLPASSETHTGDAEGLFSMESMLVVRDSSLGSVTCSTFNPILGQEKAMAVFTPGKGCSSLLQILGSGWPFWSGLGWLSSEPFFPQASLWIPAFAMSMTMMGLLVIGSSCFLRRERCARLQVHQEWEDLRREQEELQKTKEDALKMTYRRKAAYMTGSVTLDPDSAHSSLAISQDRRRVTRKYTTVCLDDLFCVLGMEGITSGGRYWEVEIRSGDSSKWTPGVCREDVDREGSEWTLGICREDVDREGSEWILGVCREDVDREGFYPECPKKGIWTVGRSSSGYWADTDNGRASLSFSQAPQWVGEGDISFYNMSEMSHIFSFHGASFSGTLFPHFRLKSGDVSMILSSLEHDSEGEGEEGEEGEEEEEAEEREEMLRLSTVSSLPPHQSFRKLWKGGNCRMVLWVSLLGLLLGVATLWVSLLGLLLGVATLWVSLLGLLFGEAVLQEAEQHYWCIRDAV
ncbi:hypothetical protein U0070_000940 [Myodes glareolus]|uniref:Uncharacterized protein n=1 Tax=Myodes glareolus TaxID=447135 RepID=A0AAW0H698_MYOGA